MFLLFDPTHSPFSVASCVRQRGEVVIMGGAFGERRGNRTPSAEANFFDGPEAAQVGPDRRTRRTRRTRPHECDVGIVCRCLPENGRHTRKIRPFTHPLFNTKNSGAENVGKTRTTMDVRTSSNFVGVYVNCLKGVKGMSPMYLV